MELSAKYDPSIIEDKWYKHWLTNNFFHSEPDNREPYTIVIPPPNVTGVLHMGHMLNNTIQDILVRRARMKGKNACWVPGTDHASIATEAKVVQKLKIDGIEKNNISREEFLNHAWEWKEKHGGIILEQLKKLGASCDWQRTKFTMDENLYESVIDVFIDLYNKGLIYRGVRMVNWDPKALTALSDEEVIYKEVKSKLYYLRYKIENSDNEWITIATTRPETILGDTAVCVNPYDQRYKNLKGKKVLVPLIKRSIPIIEDEYVDMEFGTGCLKITPAHDINDYNIGLKHRLESIDIFNDNGTLNEKALLYIGKDRFEVRELIINDLLNHGHVLKIDDYVNNVGFSERTDEVIEPKLSLQWFLKMENLSKPALEVVMNNTIQFYPEKFKNTYRYWLENVRDWCISRQLWWGQRIPAFYTPNGDVFVAKTAENALQKAKENEKYKDLILSDLKQDEDVLDTWFSSWLWPISVFDGIRNPNNKEINYYYPTNDLVTAPEILFFWVARMIIAGIEYKNEVPFKNVYLTGIVRDKIGRKMSKSLGNSPDPIDLINKYGADGVRAGMLFTSPAGNDLPFDETLCEQGRNFSNKIWNALRLIKSWKINDNLNQPDYATIANKWFESKLNFEIAKIEESFIKYRLSEALMDTYKLIWDDFCSWYLEIIKPQYQSPIDSITYHKAIDYFEKLMKLLHPFMPFITEEVWHLLTERNSDESIMMCSLTNVSNFNNRVLDDFNFIEKIIINIRTIRKDKNIANKDKINLIIMNNFEHIEFIPLIEKICNISKTEITDIKPINAISFTVNAIEFFIPLQNTNIDVTAEKDKLKKELDYLNEFLQLIMKKLNNQNFMLNAKPEIIAIEEKKHNDTKAKIEIILSQLKNLE